MRAAAMGASAERDRETPARKTLWNDGSEDRRREQDLAGGRRPR